MCGIHAAISPAAHLETSVSLPLPVELRHCLCNRGPDHFGQAVACHTSLNGQSIALSFTSTVLALRGDHVTKQPFLDDTSGSILCWNGEAWKINGSEVKGNDGEAVFRLLVVSNTGAGPQTCSVLDVLRSIEGPFAFLYYDKPAGHVYFGRDRLGRRSLLIKEDDDRRLVLSSVAESTDPGWTEVEADGVYVVSLSGANGYGSRITRHDWIAGDIEGMISSIGHFNMSLPSAPFTLTARSTSVQQLRDRLTESLCLRVLHVPEPPGVRANSDTRIAVLFSGGLDCTVLARMSHDILPPEQGVDLINVAFENPRIAFQLAKTPANGAITDIYEACPDRITGRKSFAELQRVCPGRAWHFITVNIPYSETVSHRSEVVSLMHPHNTEMDLSIAYALYFAARGQGFCYTGDDSNPLPYTSTARVLLSGLGADELFGGYVRHVTAFLRQGYAGLVDELKLDVSRLGKRNLGRDDRVMAQWGREVRFPYLDEEFVKWAIECPAWEKCDFENPADGESSIEPGKRVLRLVAAELGMKEVAREKKRAIQFGSRTAKMESGRVKGTMLIS